MNIDYVVVVEENREYFADVIPDVIALKDNRVAVAAVDDDGRVLGAISYVAINYAYEIDWIYVLPDVRRQGIGLSLVDEVLRAVMLSGERLPVTARYEFTEEDQQMHAFFLSCTNMMTSYSHERYYIKASDIKSSEVLHSMRTEDLIIQPFFDETEQDQKEILGMLSNQNSFSVSDYDEWKKECVQELCQCAYLKNNLMDFIFFRKLADGNLELSFLYSKNPKGLLELLVTTVSKLETLFPGTSLTFEAMGDESEKLARHLFPGAQTVHIYEAEF
ncbi:MAG: GNAT family N-acetyltransferase [Butyrivibrio sp.]|nr:GNAT family N-acetyltransferase [Butyrivibrio sp.]